MQQPQQQQIYTLQEPQNNPPSDENEGEKHQNQGFHDEKDNSLIYQLIHKKDQYQNNQQITSHANNTNKRPPIYQNTQRQDYGQPIEINELLLKGQNMKQSDINRDDIYKNYKHVEQDNKLKVYIDPNPSNNGRIIKRIKPINQKLITKNQSVQKLNSKPLSTQKIHNQRKSIEIASSDKKEKKNIVNDLRIRQIHRVNQYNQKDQPKTRRKQQKNNKKPQRSRPDTQSNLSDSESNVLQEFLQFKEKKKSKSVNFLIKKVQSLQKYIRQMKGQSEYKDKKKLSKASNMSQRSQLKQNRLSSNLISIKIDTQNLHIKDDIMSELKKLRQKVDILQNKSNDFNSSKKIASNKFDYYQSISPQNMTQSKIQSNSKLIYSQIREGNGKISGKIFKKSEVRANNLENNQIQPFQQQKKEKSPQKIEELNFFKMQQIQFNKEEPKDQRKHNKQQTNIFYQPRNKHENGAKMYNNAQKPAHNQEQQVNSHAQPRDAITIIKNKHKKDLISPQERIKTQQQLNHHLNNISQVQKKESTKILEPDINEIHHKGAKDYQSQANKNGEQINQQRAFIRSGNIAKRTPANHVVPKENVSRQDWQQSLKMLQFDLGKERFIVDTEQDRKFSNEWYKQISSFREAEEMIPKAPQIMKLPTYDSTEEELIAMGKELFNLFEVAKINDDQTVLKVKKYKNCIYFGIDNENNILLHYEGKVYFGGWKEFMNGQGEKFGDGIQYQKQKFIFKGNFKEGKKSGLGIYKVFNSSLKVSIYIGQFNEGLKHGQGKQFDENGISYVGQWKDGRKDGFGRLQLGKRQYYQGIFQKGLKSGHGSQFFQNGDKYQGEYSMGKFQGKGKYEWANGSVYDGIFKNGMRNGRGLWRSSNTVGDEYQGDYENDLKHGHGIYRWSNGSSYQGTFFKDQKHGKGVITHQNGKTSTLEWNNGNVIGKDHPGQKVQMVLNNANIRNYNKSLPINKNFLSNPKQKTMQAPLTNMNALNKMKPTYSTYSNHNHVNSNPALNNNESNNRHKNTLMHPQFNQRPMTSKSSNSSSHFKLQRKSQHGFPKDPPYRGIQLTSNINKF